MGKTKEDVKKALEKLAKGKGWETVAKAWEKSKVPGQPAEVTLPYSTTEKTAVGDTTLGKKPEELAKKGKTDAKKVKLVATEVTPAEAKKAWKESGAPGKPTEVTLLHSITEETAVGYTTLGGKDGKELAKKGKTDAQAKDGKGYEKLYQKEVKGKPAEVPPLHNRKNHRRRYNERKNERGDKGAGEGDEGEDDGEGKAG